MKKPVVLHELANRLVAVIYQGTAAWKTAPSEELKMAQAYLEAALASIRLAQANAEKEALGP